MACSGLRRGARQAEAEKPLQPLQRAITQRRAAHTPEPATSSAHARHAKPRSIVMSKTPIAIVGAGAILFSAYTVVVRSLASIASCLRRGRRFDNAGG